MTKDTLLYKELKKLEEDYSSPITIADGLEVDYKDVLKTVEYYMNSRYLNGNSDENGDIPFMNVVNANADVSKVATDFDTKDIQPEADDGEQYDKSLVFRKEIYNWMKRANFAKTLNDMNSVRIDYGEVLVKRVEKMVDGKKELVLEIPEWQNLDVNASNIIGSPIIERHYMTPADFAEKMDTWENVREVLKKFKNREAGGDTEILVKEVNGKFPVSVYKDVKGETPSEDDDFVYQQYRFFVASVNGEDIYLYCDEQDQNPYKKLSWKKRAKRPGVGVIEEGTPAQIWINDVIQKEHKWFELASKAVLQSGTRSLKGRNILSEVENGTILETDKDGPISSVNLVASAVPEFQNLIDKWRMQYDREASITDAVRGENPPSGQAFRLQAMVQQQSNSTFNQRRQEMGIFIVELFNDWILPHISKQLNKVHILASEYSAEELKALDENYANYKANQKAKGLVFASIQNDTAPTTIEEYEQVKQGYKDFIAQTKDKRFLDIPDNYYKDFKPKITIVTTGEQKNKMAMMESLSNILTIYSSNPALFQQDPTASQILSLILEKSGAGVSPITLGLGQNKSMATMMQQGTGVQQQPQPQDAAMQTVQSLAPQATQNEQT